MEEPTPAVADMDVEQLPATGSAEEPLLASVAADESMRDGTPPPPEKPAAGDIEAMATKKRKAAQIADEGKKRSRRMFGVLQATLLKAKQDVSEGQLAGAGKRRKDIEDRLAAKLNGEKAQLEEKTRREREAKDLRLQVIRKEEEINVAETLYQVRHATKLHLASFLCTTFALPPPAPSTDGITVPFALRLPHASKISAPSAPRPIYYKPFRLLPAQQDAIQDQLASVRRSVDRERSDWRDAKQGKQSELRDAKRKRDEGIEEIARSEREERQRRRRATDGNEGEEVRDRDQSRSRSRTPPRDGDDVKMSDRRSASRSRSPDDRAHEHEEGKTSRGEGDEPEF